MSTASEPDILIVDDDRPIRNLVRQIVRRMGCTSREAVDGEEAIELLEEKSPDLLILDLMMPKVSGWDVLDWLKSNNYMNDVPVIVLTAVGSDRTEALERYDVTAVVSKPFEVTTLMETLRDIVEG